MSTQEQNAPAQLLSTAQAAKILSVTTRSIQRWAREGLLPAMKIQGKTGPYVFEERVISDALADGVTRDGIVVLQGTRRTPVAS